MCASFSGFSGNFVFRAPGHSLFEKAGDAHPFPDVLAQNVSLVETNEQNPNQRS
jgi:hypothetical protein